MDLPRIRELRRRIQRLRPGIANIKPRELVALAEAVGRSPRKGGKEPTYVMDGRPPLQIPQHGSSKRSSVAKYTAKNILDHLEEDLDYLESEFKSGGGSGTPRRGRHE